jgi:hypothetical protein
VTTAVRPLLAAGGATPQSLAKAASVWIRLALSSAVTRNCPSEFDADDVEFDELGCSCSDQGFDLPGCAL